MYESSITALRTISKQLKSIEFPNGCSVANKITENYPEKYELSAKELDAAKLIMELLEVDENSELNFDVIAKAIIRGENEILKIGFFLRDFGFTVDEIREMLQENNVMLIASTEVMKEICSYLKSKGLNRERVKSVLSYAVNTGIDEVKLRCETVLKYFSQETFKKLTDGFLFFPHYTAPVECIEYAVEKCGAKKAEKLFLENEMLLYWFKDEYERENPFQGQHAHALKLIDKA